METSCLGPLPEVMKTFKATAEAKIKCVIEYIELLLRNEVKFLLFAHHHIMIDALEQRLQKIGTGYIRIDGRTPPGRRCELVEHFQGDTHVRVALLSITACGQGLTLTAAHTVVFAELHWVPGQLVQAEDRAHRIGQRQSVDIRYCIAEGTLDERMFFYLDRKHRETTGVLDGVVRGMAIEEEGPIVVGVRPAPVVDLDAEQSADLSSAVVDLTVDAPGDATDLAKSQKRVRETSVHGRRVWPCTGDRVTYHATGRKVGSLLQAPKK